MNINDRYFGKKADLEGSKILSSDILTVVENRIYFYSEIERENILTLNKNLREVSNTLISKKYIQGSDSIPPIYLHINSYGGTIFAGLSALDEIEKINDNVSVITIIDGCCASAATFLSLVGKERWINKHAYMLIHQLSSAMWGKFSEFEDEMKNLKNFMTAIKEIYVKYTNLPEKKLDEILKHDIWFNAEECIKYGMADKII